VFGRESGTIRIYGAQQHALSPALALIYYFTISLWQLQANDDKKWEFLLLRTVSSHPDYTLYRKASHRLGLMK
jgi:hypothetical protein